MSARPLIVFASLAMAAVTLVGCSRQTVESNPIVEALPVVFEPSAAEAARDAFNMYDPDLRRRSVLRLSNADFGGEEPYLKTYRLLIDDPDPTVRAAAVAALGRWGQAGDVPAIVILLARDESSQVRWESAKALQRIHSDQAVTPLLTALENEVHPDVRIACANALGQYPSRAVFDSLVAALNDNDYGVVREARKSLHILTGQSFGDDGRDWWAWAEDTADLFAQQKTYYYPQFDGSPSILQRITFDKLRTTPAPRTPRGSDDS